MELSAGIDDDQHVEAALHWLASVSGDGRAFWRRIDAAQERYRAFTEAPSNLGKDPELRALGPDVVASFLAQAMSLLNKSRTFDIALASRCIPWVKQLGVHIDELVRVGGAAERARRMLADAGTSPDGPMLELVMGGNYASDGMEVAFVPEAPGQSRTPDLHLALPGESKPVAVELKRLRQGQYERAERAKHGLMFRRAAALIDQHRLSLHIDVTYSKELKDIPEDYLADRLTRFLACPLVLFDAYPWRDEYGEGAIRPANLQAVQRDIENSSLYFGTKMARLLSGGQVPDNGYHLAASGKPDHRDPRYMDEVHYATVVTWRCFAVESIEKKARHVKSKLAEAESQVRATGRGIIHLAMDAAPNCDSSDLRRERNKQAILEFESESLVTALYVHYLVPRISEEHSWLVDETVDKFSADTDTVPSIKIFSRSKELDNDLPAWKQSVSVPKH